MTQSLYLPKSEKGLQSGVCSNGHRENGEWGSMYFRNCGCLGVCGGLEYRRKAQRLQCWAALARGMIDRKLVLQRPWREDWGGLTVTVVSYLRPW